MLFRFRANREYCEKILPQPLQPTEDTDKVLVFANETLTLMGPTEMFEKAEPERLNWHELILSIPCRYKDIAGKFYWVIYKDVEWSAMLNLWSGMPCKLAEFKFMRPLPSQELNDVPKQGAIVKMTVSRYGNRIFTGSLKMTQKVDPMSSPTIQALTHPGFRMRYLPNHEIAAGGRPVKHDILIGKLTGFKFYGETWKGEGRLTFGDSEEEELYHFNPIEMLDCYWVNLTNRVEGHQVIYDYLAQ